MHKLVFCCLIIIGFSYPLSSLPIINASEMSYQLSGKSLLILMVIKQGLEQQNQKRSRYAFQGAFIWGNLLQRLMQSYLDQERASLSYTTKIAMY
uniref:Uncharacterized protein n=1 Tax=Aquila chrysaetos chrysaetos TaxID=223781 RepID=A0A663DTA7_AQUCH